MFIAVYRYTLKPGSEEQFRKDWAEVTRLGLEEGGSFGSSLGRARDGSWVAVARWPSKEIRDDWFARGTRMDGPVARMRAAMVQRFDDLEIEISDDLTSR